MEIVTEPLTIETHDRLQLINLTDRLRERVEAWGIAQGLLLLLTLHTTTALFINEFQWALMEDLKRFLAHLIQPDADYKHNCEDCSDCERKNADAHIRAIVLGHHLVLPIHEATLALGKWQSVIFAELDGPRERQVLLQVLGAGVPVTAAIPGREARSPLYHP